MATNVLQDQQYMSGVHSLLTAQKALLIRNNLADMLLRRPVPQLPQFMLWDKCLNELRQYVEK